MIWSAGCATGEEPYSIAMLLAEAGVAPSDVDLLGTDLNALAIESARVGRFGARRMAQVAQDRVRRFFRATEGMWEIDAEVKRRVRFEPMNLAAPEFSLVGPASCDVILCRNVIIYFDHATIRALMDRFFTALRPGGYLVLGYSESLFRVYERFEMTEVAGAFLYRRPLQDANRRAAGLFGPSKVPADEKRDRGTFVTARPDRSPFDRRKPEPPPRAIARSIATSVPDAARLMEDGRFDEARDTLAQALGVAPDDVSALLTLGNLHSLMGRAEDARRAFDDVLGLEPLCVDARVYGALAAMQISDWASARAEIGKALFLEPGLALAHYLAAEIAVKLGDRAGARRSYRNAIAQLVTPQRALAGFCPDLPESEDRLAKSARYALSALEEDDAA
jgi:chemotaxis protein methyltransferase CheR